MNTGGYTILEIADRENHWQRVLFIKQPLRMSMFDLYRHVSLSISLATGFLFLVHKKIQPLVKNRGQIKIESF
jgi:hypothetical protein